MERYYFSHNHSISIANIWINGGSECDQKNKKGLNQLLLTLILRGCKGFNNYSFSEYINSYGAELNYEIYEDGIFLSIKSLKKFFKKLYPLLEKLIQEPNLYEKDFHICKNHAIDNINKSKENLFHIAYENWRKIVYNNHPYAFNSEGYIQDLEGITYGDTEKEFKKFKLREKFLISNFKLDNLKKIEGNSIQNLIKKDNLIIQDESKKRFISQFSNSKQTIIMIGNKTCFHQSLDYLPLKILESHLSFGMSSVLFKLFREKNGLTYDIGISYPVRRSFAPFLIYLSVSEKNSIFALKILLKLWNSISKRPLSKDEIKLAKIKLYSSILNSYQSLEEISSRKIQLIGFKINPMYDELLMNRINSINPEDVVEVSKKYLTSPFISVIGKEKTCNEIKKIWKETINF
tara:strand:- start:321 stop:1535 length:1215 start_codon:yes stop_codon:yes gene_type:complete